MSSVNTDTGEIEKSAMNVAREMMLGKLIVSAMKQLRGLDKPFLLLSEQAQRNVIGDLRDDVTRALIEAVDIIAADNRTKFRAACESVTFKDGVKAVLTMTNTAASHELVDTAGGSVLIVIENSDRYTQGGSNIPKPAPAQNELPV